MRAGEVPTIVLIFPSGSQFVRSNLRVLSESRMLALFCTTVAWRGDRRILDLLPRGLSELLQTRAFPEVEEGRLRCFPFREIVNRIAHRTGAPLLSRHEVGWASSDGVSRALDAAVARLIRRREVQASAVYGYDYAALWSLEAAAEAGMRRFYELPIGYWRAAQRILGEEAELNPEWAVTIESLRDSDLKHERKDAELGLAEHVVVPSEFVRDTLREHPGMTASVDVIPYGAPPTRTLRARLERTPKLRLLYVGHLSQRKGISYLFAAMRRLAGLASLTLVGPRIGGHCPALEAELARHTWLGAVSHDRVLETMAEHDVLVFPSLFEGLAQVIPEALAQGLPVIATRNSGGTAIIDDGEDGFIVPIRDADAIAARVTQLVEDRGRLEAMRAAALRKASERSWAMRESVFLTMMRARLGAVVA
ncbi:MAG TPA: glycosyltransferase family 4 protein [Stellaceae bacterium]|nr:glycosyltransferase family 4 protein [Stellaceae bacterium]